MTLKLVCYQNVYYDNKDNICKCIMDIQELNEK